MVTPAEYRYSTSHEWIDLASGTVGITHHAQNSLGDIVHVELPAVGRHVKKGEAVAEVESVKAVGEIYAPASGVVTAVNSELEANAGLVNSSPYRDGWLFRIAAFVDQGDLLDAAAYDAHAGH